LDKEITTGMQLAGKSCKTAKRLPCSGKLQEAQTRLRIYQKLLTQIRTQLNMSAQILKRQAQLTISIPLPTTLANTNTKLRASQKEVRELSQKAYDLCNKQKKELDDAIATQKAQAKKKPFSVFSALNTQNKCSPDFPASNPKPPAASQ
jgi:hypothetical protein